MQAFLRAHGLTKRFPGVVALDSVDFHARGGEVHAPMGESGAGKSTLIKLLTGVYPWDSGQLELDGIPIQPSSPLQARRLGIATVYQEVNLIPALTVAENIFLGQMPKRWSGIGGVDSKAMNCGATGALARLDVHIDVNRPVQHYSIPLQQMVAIARSLSVSAKAVIAELEGTPGSAPANDRKRVFDESIKDHPDMRVVLSQTGDFTRAKGKK